MKFLKPFILTLLLSVSSAVAGQVDVIDVKVNGAGENYTFSVTVEHADEGWDHYANKWEVVGENGEVYGTRILAHPHVNEQPFTRQGNAKIPLDVKTVIVRAYDSLHGAGGKEVTVELPNR